MDSSYMGMVGVNNKFMENYSNVRTLSYSEFVSSILEDGILFVKTNTFVSQVQCKVSKLKFNCIGVLLYNKSLRGSRIVYGIQTSENMDTVHSTVVDLEVLLRNPIVVSVYFKKFSSDYRQPNRQLRDAVNSTLNNHCVSIIRPSKSTIYGLCEMKGKFYDFMYDILQSMGKSRELGNVYGVDEGLCDPAFLHADSQSILCSMYHSFNIVHDPADLTSCMYSKMFCNSTFLSKEIIHTNCSSSKEIKEDYSSEFTSLFITVCNEDKEFVSRIAKGYEVGVKRSIYNKINDSKYKEIYLFGIQHILDKEQISECTRTILKECISSVPE